MKKVVTSGNLNILRQALFFVMYAILLTPLLLSTKFFFPFISSKTFYFRLLVEIALVLYILLAVADERFRPKITKISIAIFVLLGIFILTSLFGANFYRSFWGNTERGEGLLTFLHIITFFTILTGLLQTRKQWARYLFTSIMVSVAVAYYAMSQKMGASWVVPGDISRISGTIGNASFFAGYLISNIFLALWLSLSDRAKWQKILLWAVIVYELIILNATKTRGAILALIIGVLIILFLTTLTARRKKVRLIAAGIFLAIILFGGLVWIFRDSSTVSRLGGLQRVTEISKNDITTESRLLTWQASWKGWKDRFFTGYGYENFNIAFNKYFPAEIFRDSGSQIWFDRAHNVFFEISVTSGIFGILTYLAIFVLSFWSLIKYYRRDPEENRFTAIIFFAFLVAYFLQNLFVFDTMGTYISFYSILAFLVFLQHEPKEQEGIKIKKDRTVLVPGTINAPLGTVLVICLVAASYFFVFKPARANLYITDALRGQAMQDLEMVLNGYEKAIALDTYANEEARQKLGETMLKFRGSSETNPELLSRGYRMAIEELKKAIAVAPQDARNYVFLMSVYNYYPTTEIGPREEVIRLGKKALELSPTRPQIYFEMGQAAHSLGRFDEGISYFQKGLALNPKTAESHWNLSLAYLLAGKYPEATAEVDWVFEQGRISKISDSSIANMISLQEQRGVVENLLELYDELIDRRPGDENLQKRYFELTGISK